MLHPKKNTMGRPQLGFPYLLRIIVLNDMYIPYIVYGIVLATFTASHVWKLLEMILSVGTLYLKKIPWCDCNWAP